MNQDQTRYKSRAIVLDSDRPRHLETAAFDLPAPAPGELLLQSELAGICGADLHNYDGWFKRGRVVPGHELVGRVATLNGEFRDARGRPLAVGDRVAVESLMPCGRCRYCLGRHSRPDKTVDYNACEVSQLFGSVTIGEPPRVVGGWSDYVQIPHNALLHRVPADVPAEAAVLLEPLSVAVKAVTKAGVLAGDTVVVQGPGPIGLLTVAAAAVAGATQIILVGTNRRRLEAGLTLGAHQLLDLAAGDPVEAVRAATGGRLADRVIDASGALPAFQQGLDMTGRGGVYVNVGGFRPTDEVTFRPDRLKREKIDIRFSHLGTSAYEPALAIILSRRFPLEALVTHHFPLVEAERALHLLERREGSPIKIALTFEE